MLTPLLVPVLGNRWLKLDVRPPGLAGWTRPRPSLFSAPQSLAEATVATLGQVFNVGKDHFHIKYLRRVRAEIRTGKAGPCSGRTNDHPRQAERPSWSAEHGAEHEG